MGLYGERVGCLTLLTRDAAAAQGAVEMLHDVSARCMRTRQQASALLHTLARLAAECSLLFVVCLLAVPSDAS